MLALVFLTYSHSVGLAIVLRLQNIIRLKTRPSNSIINFKINLVLIMFT
jgi:hypothetical protein